MYALKAAANAQTGRAAAGRQQPSARNVKVASLRNVQRPSVSHGELENTEVSRRAAVLGGLLVASVAAASPAQAFLGIGDGANLDQQYQQETGAVLGLVREVLALPKGDDSTEGKVKDLRKEINKWVAKYRREPKFSGKPSYGNTYSVLNALAGHFNSFGPTAPIPKKRLERIVKELDDAEKFLARSR